MYGIWLHSAFECLRATFGLEMARDILDMAENREPPSSSAVTFAAILSESDVLNCSSNSRRRGSCRRIDKGRSPFSFHQYYSEKLMPRLAEAAARLTRTSSEKLFEQFGRAFVTFCRQSDYDVVLKSMGRNLREFIMSLDSVHDHIRSTYPKMKAPSFAVLEEEIDGMLICYRSMRGGFDSYVIGILKEAALAYFNIQMSVTVLSHMPDDDGGANRGRVSAILKLEFDNQQHFDRASLQEEMCVDDIKGRFLRADVLMQCAPFYVAFNHELEILSIGRGLKATMPCIVGDEFNVTFEIVRPLCECAWESINNYKFNIFEVVSIKAVELNALQGGDFDDDERTNQLRLRGEMVYFKEHDCMVFMGMPVINSFKQLSELGMKTSDLSMTDSSRDLISRRRITTIDENALVSQVNQELMMSSQLTLVDRQADAYRLKHLSDLEELVPSHLLSEDYSLEDYIASLHKGAAVVCCHLDIDEFFQNRPQIVVSALNSINDRIDAIIAKWSNCSAKIFTVTNSFLLVVGPPTASHLAAPLALEIAFHLMDDIKSVLSTISICSHFPNQTSVPVQIGIEVGPVEAAFSDELSPPRFCVGGPTVARAWHIATFPPISGRIVWTHRVSGLLSQSHLKDCYTEKPFFYSKPPIGAKFSNGFIGVFQLQTADRHRLTEIAAMIHSKIVDANVPRVVTRIEQSSTLFQTNSSRMKSSPCPSSSTIHQMNFIETALMDSSIKVVRWPLIIRSKRDSSVASSAPTSRRESLEYNDNNVRQHEALTQTQSLNVNQLYNFRVNFRASSPLPFQEQERDYNEWAFVSPNFSIRPEAETRQDENGKVRNFVSSMCSVS